jgi:DNA-directed RNA polymerase specialized sigma24 family protein
MSDVTPPAAESIQGRRPLDRRAAGEARLFRVAYLLTGSRAAAAELVVRASADRPEFESLEPAMLDRLMIQAARSATPAPRADHPVLRLPEQQREAWILARVDRVDDLWLARAMDCSKTAARNHLAAAEETLARVLAPSGADPDGLARQLAAQADALDPAPLLHHARSARRRRRITKVVTIAIVTLTIVTAALMVWLRVR